MSDQLVKPYPEIVRALFKPLPVPFMYLHAAVGILGEHIELQQGRARLPMERAALVANEIEELGDMAFYIQAGLNFNNLTLEQFIGVPKETDWRFLFEAGELLDTAKRYAIYSKALEEERWNRHLHAVTACFMSELRICNLSLLQVQLANQEKLLTGEKARYALGLYTDEQANARADKG